MPREFYYSRVFAIIVLLAMYSLPVSAQVATEPDTIRVDDGRITIIVEDGSVVVQEGRRSTAYPRAQREVRVERMDSPRGIWMMHRDGDDADTLTFDFENIARMVERSARIPRNLERWIEDIDVAPLGDAMRERSEVVRREAEVRELARQARSAEGAERERLEAELMAELDELFNMKLEAERERLATMEERLEERRRSLDERRARRGEIIERRYRELLGDRDVLEW